MPRKANNTYHVNGKVSFLLFFLFIALTVMSSPNVAAAQSSDSGQREVKPGMAFLRSAVLPGWGHHYVQPESWRRGKYHMIAEGILLATYFGFDIRSSYMDDRLTTIANASADADLNAHGRSYELAVGNYNNLAEYNEAQLQQRNWNQLFPDSPEYVWNWKSEAKRDSYQDIRDSRDRLERQLPGLLSLMVVNRIISGISAYNWANELNSEGVERDDEDYFSEGSLLHKVRNRTSIRFLPTGWAEPDISAITGTHKGYMARFTYHF